MPDNKCPILFLEEGIRSGGAGMNIADKLRLKFDVDILAIDDNFVTDRKAGESIYRSAGLDAENICDKINKLISK